jgi:hypothetical protein
MTKLSEEARQVLQRILTMERAPAALRRYIVQQMEGRNARQTSLDDAIRTIRDNTATLAARRAAVDLIIQYAKGDA